MGIIISYLTDIFGPQGAAAVQISIMVFVAFLIGVITVWSNQRAKMSKLKNDIKSIKSELSLTKEEFRRVKNEKDKVVESYNAINGDNKKLVDEYKHTKKELDELKTEFNMEKNRPLLTPLGYKDEIRKLKAETVKLKNDIDTLSQQNQKLRDEAENIRDEKHVLREEYSKLKGFVMMEKQTASIEIRDAKYEAQRYKSESERLHRDVDSLNKSIHKLNEEMVSLKKQENDIKHKIVEETVVPEPENDFEKITDKQHFEREKKKLLDSIGVVHASEKEDLQQIRGIGPFIEKKLNKIGVYTIKQVSSFTRDDVERATDLIKYFPGRIERDNWIFQAKEIIRVRTKKIGMSKKASSISRRI